MLSAVSPTARDWHTQSAPPATAGFVLLLQDCTGRVCIEYAENARLRLHQLAQGGVDVDTYRHEHSPCARLIAERIRTQFAPRALESSANWFLIDWGQAVTALEDHDLDTGEIARAGELLLGSLVQVKCLSELGEVRGFRQEGQRRMARVVFCRPIRTAGAVCIAAYFPVSELRLVVPQPTMPEAA